MAENREEKMSLKTRIIIILVSLVVTAAVVSIVSADTDAILEFFGFGKATRTPAPTAEQVISKSQKKTPAPDTDPFGGIDPALVELDEPEISSKASDSWFTDDWEEDPFAYSFSSSSFDENPSTGQQKDVSNFGNNRIIITPTPTKMSFHRFPFNPVFCQRCQLPRTGFPTGRVTEIRESVNYTPTNMTLSIPTLNVNEKIVIVPLVDDNFPVENLGSDIGLLEGSGPTKEDLFVLAGHNHLNNEEQGPFAKLSSMEVSDLIFVQGAKNESRKFVVYANEKFAEDDVEGLLEMARPGCMILITCEDESIEGGYLNRRVIFAEAKED